MKDKILLIAILLLIAVTGGIVIFQISAGNVKPDLVEINRIKISAETTEDFTNWQPDFKYNFTIVSVLEENKGEIIFTTAGTTKKPLLERLNDAVLNYDTVIDFERSGKTEGKIIIYTGAGLNSAKNFKIIAITIILLFLIAAVILYYIYLKVNLYSPFKRLKGFAVQVAAGNFDVPLPMDRRNLFGSFSESFDLMREELKKAQDKAAAEERSKKELIASLSHDIKTPVSIILAQSELLVLNEKNEKKLALIKTIQLKTHEMKTLITDLFNSALKDLSELKIELKDVTALEAADMIKSADSLKKIVFTNSFPDCLIKVDPLRLGQIFNNIISNSYKYANTAIEVSFVLREQVLKISFKDFGNTLDADELPELAGKFYRGRNAQGRPGAGLGLYICSYLLQRMNGELELKCDKDSFTASIILNLS